MSFGPPVSTIREVELDITIIRGRDLVANEGNLFGKKKSSDPYAVIFWGGGKCGKTQTKSKTLNPDWNENFKIKVESKYMKQLLRGDPTYSVVNVVIFDKDKFSRKDPLGTVTIPLVFVGNPTNLPATWYTIEKGQEPYYCKKASGELEIQLAVSVEESIEITTDDVDGDKTKILQCGETIHLNDYFNEKQIPDVLALHIRWNVPPRTKIDPHVSAICFDDSLNLIDIASFKEIESKDEAITHDQTRKRFGENISFAMNKVNQDVVYICIVINSYKAKDIDVISKIDCVLHEYPNDTSKTRIAEYKYLKSSPLGKHSAILLCCFYRGNQTLNSWMMRSMAELAPGRTTNEVVDAIQNILHQTISFSAQPPIKHSSGLRAELVEDT